MFDTLPVILNATRRRSAQSTALIFEGRRFTYEEVDDLSGSLAAALAGRGVRPGDRIVIHTQNCWEWVVAFYGTLKAGAVAVPVNHLLTADELSFIVNDCRPRAIIIGAEKSAVAHALAEEIEGSLVIRVGDGVAAPGVAFETLLSEQPGECVPRDPGDPAMIGYTSGTTGRPKGAMLPHRALSLNANLTALMHGRSSDDVVVSALPLPHVYVNVVMNATFRSGGSLNLLRGFNVEDALAAVEASRATMFEGVPTMYFYMLASASLPKHDYKTLRLCTVGGQTMPVDKMQAVESAFGCPLVELWGMTELAGLGTTHPHTGPRRHGSIGVALPFMETRIAAEGSSAEAPMGEVGELLVRGPLLMLGYYENEKATSDAVTADGWLRTGDLAFRDEDAFITVVDRKKDMILSGGYNVYPAEIERVISSHPAVSMVAVVGRAHETKGEAAAAYIVLKPGAAADAAMMDAYCRERLAAYKAPRHYFFVPDLPKTSTGKILRRALRDQ